jgi:AcrR family transcriptional regulator
MIAEPTRERILVEASKMLQASGLAGFSMRKLAQTLELSATALYRHYADKEQLLVAACAEGFERFATSLWQALQEPSDWERLRATPRQYMRFAMAEPHFYRVMFMTPVKIVGWDTLPEVHQRRIRGTFEFLVDRVSAARLAQPFIWDDVRKTAASIWSHCHGLVALRFDSHFDDLDQAQFQAFYAASIDAHLRGLCARVDLFPTLTP